MSQTMSPPVPPLSQPVPNVPRSRANPYPKESRTIAKELFLQGLKVRAIAEEVNVPLATVRKWMERDAWGKLETKARAIIVQRGERMSASVSDSALQGQSLRVRQALAKGVEIQTEALLSQSVRPLDLPNTPQRQGKTAVLKALAETAATVFDWGTTQQAGIIVIGDVERLDPMDAIATPTAIDIGDQGVQTEATPTDIVPQGEVISDTPTGSVPPE